MPAFNKTTILGTGTMGPGMGAVLERAGSETHLFDISPEALEKAAAGVEMARGVLDRLDAPSADGGSIVFSNSLEEAVAGADLVIEAIPEKIDL